VLLVKKKTDMAGYFRNINMQYNFTVHKFSGTSKCTNQLAGVAYWRSVSSSEAMTVELYKIGKHLKHSETFTCLVITLFSTYFIQHTALSTPNMLLRT
jgi:hypothetical protein